MAALIRIKADPNYLEVIQIKILIRVIQIKL